MEAIERLQDWASDFEEIDDVLDDSYFNNEDEMVDVEDDDFHD